MPVIVIFHPEGNLANNPHLSAMTHLLAERGHQVFVCAPSGRFVTPTAAAVRVSESPPLHPRPDIVVGVDAAGLIQASSFAKRHGSPLVYLSYEIFFSEETDAALKREEREAAASVSLAISQDDNRARLLAQEAGLDEKIVFRMPVAGCRPCPGPPVRTWPDKFGIPPDRKIAIFAGCVAEWSGIPALVKTLERWPARWVLLVHDRYSWYPDWLYAARESHPGTLYISEGGFPSLQQLGSLLHGVDLGIALYLPTFDSPYEGRNLVHVGMSSGKIATYLQHGLPVLVNEIGEMSERIKANNLGLVVKDVSEIPGLLQNFEPSSYKTRCSAYFEHHLDAALYIKELEDRLLSLLPTQSL
jgi:hypothetical protein